MRTLPKSETYLAAELASLGVNPGIAANCAHRLCALGRRYRRLAERLCGGEEEWGPHPRAGALIERAERQCERLMSACRELLGELGFYSLELARSDLSLVVRSRPSLHSSIRETVLI